MSDGAKTDYELAEYIFEWLGRRNGGELEEALGNMRVVDFSLAKSELADIIRERGRPRNWVRP